MRVSVAIATHNGVQLIQEQLASIGRQTRLPDEVVVSDDASTDATVELVAGLDLPFPVRVFSGERVGFAQNFGRAVAACTGEVIFLADQDDSWFPHKIETVMAAMEGYGAVIHDAEFANADLIPAGSTVLQRTAALQLSPSSHIKGSCTAITAELAHVALPIPSDVGHDVWIHALARGLGITRRIPDVLMLYRIHNSNTSTYAVNSLAPVNRRLMLRLRIRSLRRRLRRDPAPLQGVEELVSLRLSERCVSTR